MWMWRPLRYAAKIHMYGYKEFSLKRTIHWFRTLPARLSGRKQAETTEKGGR